MYNYKKPFFTNTLVMLQYLLENKGSPKWEGMCCN